MSKAFQIKDFPGYYITNTGDVYSRKGDGRFRKLKSHITKWGYTNIILTKNKKQYNRHIHRLVAEMFIPNPENKPQVNHLNGIKTDNRVENLAWATQSENMTHSFRVLGRPNHHPNKNKFGKDNGKSKIVLQIKDGKVIGKFYGSCEASRKIGVSQTCISECCNGKQKTAAGFQWTYQKQSDKITMCKQTKN